MKQNNFDFIYLRTVVSNTHLGSEWVLNLYRYSQNVALKSKSKWNEDNNFSIILTLIWLVFYQSNQA